MQDKKMQKLGKTELLAIIQEQQKEIENLKGTVKDLKNVDDKQNHQQEADSTVKASKKLNSKSDKTEKKNTEKKDTVKKENNSKTVKSEKTENQNVKSVKTVNSKSASKKKQNITNEKNEKNTNEQKQVNINKKKTSTNKKKTTSMKKAKETKKVKEQKPIMALVVVNNKIIKYDKLKVVLNRIKVAIKAFTIKIKDSIKKHSYNIKVILKKDVKDIKNDLIKNSKKHKKKKLTKKQIEQQLKKKEKAKRRFEFIKSFIYAGLVIVAIAIISSSYLFKVLQVNGSSMEPTLQNGELLLTSKFFKYQKGDMIAFYYNDKVLIKRVIGLEGDTIYMDDDGTIYVNNEKLEEDYVEKLDYGKCNITFPYIVPNDKIFILGDNRESSIDSRNTSIGCISTDNVIGKIKFKLFPFRVY